MRVDVLTLFPGMFSDVFAHGITRRAREAGLLSIHVHQLTDWSDGRYQRADDAPYGGGPGMVMRVEPLVRAVDDIARDGAGDAARAPHVPPRRAAGPEPGRRPRGSGAPAPRRRALRGRGRAVPHARRGGGALGGGLRPRRRGDPRHDRRRGGRPAHPGRRRRRGFRGRGVVLQRPAGASAVHPPRRLRAAPKCPPGPPLGGSRRRAPLPARAVDPTHASPAPRSVARGPSPPKRKERKNRHEHQFSRPPPPRPRRRRRPRSSARSRRRNSAPDRPDLRPGDAIRVHATIREGERERIPGVRRNPDRDEARREPEDHHSAQDLVRGVRGAHLPAPLAARGEGRGRSVRTTSAAPSSTSCGSGRARRPACARSGADPSGPLRGHGSRRRRRSGAACGRPRRRGGLGPVAGPARERPRLRGIPRSRRTGKRSPGSS